MRQIKDILFQVIFTGTYSECINYLEMRPKETIAFGLRIANI